MKSQDVRNFRRTYGFTQEALARHLQVTANTVARWERGALPLPPYLGLALNGIEARLRAMEEGEEEAGA